MPPPLARFQVDTPAGTVMVREGAPDRFDVFYTPSSEQIEAAGRSLDAPAPIKLLEVGDEGRRLTMFPTNLRTREGFLEAKYDQIASITFEMQWPLPYPPTGDDLPDLLEDLPSCFVKDYDFGLGFTKKHRYIVSAIEELTPCTAVVIGSADESAMSPDGNILYLSLQDLESVRKSVNRVVDICQLVARTVNTAEVHNFLAKILGGPPIPVRYGRSPLRKATTATALAGRFRLSDEEQDFLLGALEDNVKQVVEANPRRVALLRQDLELVELDTLIHRYEEMLRENLPESAWQDFFSDNPFILTLGTGYPVVRVQEQAFVGGRKVSGKGESITDFLLKNRMTNNSALVEIKTPTAKVLNANNGRSGVYAPHKDLVEGLNQVLDQKYKLESGIAQLRFNSKDVVFESYAVRCCLLVGTMPDGEDRVKSFELFRGNSKAVDIITFDELLQKVKQLREFLDPVQG